MKPSAELRPYVPVQLNGAASAGGGGGASALGVISTAPTAVENAAAATPPSNSFFIASILCWPGAPEPRLVGPRPIAGILYIYYAHGGPRPQVQAQRPVNVGLCPFVRKTAP